MKHLKCALNYANSLKQYSISPPKNCCYQVELLSVFMKKQCADSASYIKVLTI